MSSAAGGLIGPFGRVAVLNVDRPVHRHAHPHAHVLFKVGGADSRFRVGDRLFELGSKNAVFVNAWEPHDFPHPRTHPAALVLALYIEPEWLDAVDRKFGATTLPSLFSRAAAGLSQPIRILLHDLADAAMNRFRSNAAEEELLARTMCELIFCNSNRGWEKTGAKGRLFSADYRIRRVLNAMTRTRGEQKSLDYYSREAGLSRAHFFEIFKASTGVSPLLFVNSLKMEDAYAALFGTNDSLADISKILGFPAPSHFTRFFRNNFGVPPSEFRRTVFPRS
ncbi:MAG: AraC family transcriptional regulator [Alphaproteobacteria bacterium]|nr:AraC family transcriptional regulator [Alphaproteobacteria bacterium]